MPSELFLLQAKALQFSQFGKPSTGHNVTDMSQQHWVEGKDHLDQPAGSGLLCWKGPLLAHVQLGAHQDHQFVFEKLLSDAPKGIVVPGAIPHQSHNSSLC